MLSAGMPMAKSSYLSPLMPPLALILPIEGPYRLKRDMYIR